MVWGTAHAENNELVICLSLFDLMTDLHMHTQNDYWTAYCSQSYACGTYIDIPFEPCTNLMNLTLHV